MIRRLHHLLRGHLSDGDLILSATGDLPSPRQARLEEHLGACDACRIRYNGFKDLYRQVAQLHAEEAAAEGLAFGRQRARLIAALDRMAEEAPQSRVMEIRVPEIKVPEIRAVRAGRLGRPAAAKPRPNPILAAGLALAAISGVCVFAWIEQSRPGITSNTLLVRAEAWDSAALRGSRAGVIRQTVEISAQRRSLRRTIYRDAEGRRTAREESLNGSETQLRLRLAAAEIVWDAPLSATSYQDWHDAQRVREDHIRRAAGDLLVLTTTTPDGAVAAESLTVRDTDFHPVRRRISFRDSETVEIAELDYSVLPWTPEFSGLFRPEAGGSGPAATRPQPGSTPIPAAALSEEQLTEAELSAKLTLDRLHADTGEQIEVVRGPHGIEVQGITDTARRRDELKAELEMLPHVTASLSSIEELKGRSPQQTGPSGVRVVAVQTQATPIEAYYLAHGRDLAPLSKLSPGLLNSADAIDLESKEIDGLEGRFSCDEHMSLTTSAALSDLLFTHKRRLLAALEDEERLLAAAEIEASPPDQPPSTNTPVLPLAVAAERNLALTMELALGKGGGSRSAETVAAELVLSMNELNQRAHAIQGYVQRPASQDEMRSGALRRPCR